MNRVMSIRLNPYLVISDEASRFVEGGRLSGGSVLGVVAQRIMPASRNDNHSQNASKNAPNANCGTSPY